ncbi:MAG: hypothetical protein GYA17_04255 [Chloroflexi bacterium]|nr:hypothetical protein [Anaerolineaceae bacterium]NMB87549.1 hypothetical protein [Chloroflexota bacterium]
MNPQTDSLRPVQRMVVFDFSGTLSLNSVQFGQPEVLQAQLAESGLAGLGLDSVERYWSELVGPTWVQGSTTNVGLQGLIAAHLEERSPGRGEARQCAGRFVRAYLDHSTIDPAWQPLLAWVAQQAHTLAVIATDHYAEATTHILNQLDALGLPGVPALQTAAAGQLVVANSADLGHVKAERAFWTALAQDQGLSGLQCIGVVDDFGYHEAAQDDYAAAEKIAARQAQTAGQLADVFACRIEIHPFFTSRASSAEVFPAFLEGVKQAGRFVHSLF